MGVHREIDSEMLTGSSDLVCLLNDVLAALISSIMVVRSLPISSSLSESFSASL